MAAHLIDVSIRALGLALVVAGALWAVRRYRTAALEHAVWMTVAAGMLGLFVFGAALPKLPVRVLRSEAVPAPESVAARPVELATSPAVGLASPVPIAAAQLPSAYARREIDWIELGYAAVALVFLIRFAVGTFLVRRLIAKSSAAGGFRQSRSIAVPLTVGWLRPVILLPIEWRGWDRAKLDAVLAHESAHCRRRDGLVAALAGVNRCVFWFHPLAWWLERRLGFLAELACDEESVAALGDREAYARLLVGMAAVVSGPRGRLREHALTMAAGSHIAKRVESILTERRAFSRGLSRTGWAAMALCGVPAIWGAGAVTLEGRAPLLQLPLPPWHAPQPPELLAQARPAIVVPAPAPASAPARVAPVQFEVASVRPAASAPNARRCFMTTFTMDAGRIDITCISLQELMEHAFQLPQKQVGGPDWLHYHGGPKFDISATLPPGASEDRIPEMLQALLAERFKMTYHRESKEQNIDALVVTKDGLKLEELAAMPGDATTAASTRIETVNGIPTRLARLPDGSGNTQTNSRIGEYRETMPNKETIRWELSDTTAQGLADLMADRLKRPVVDQTGLKGRYHMVLEVKTAQMDPAVFSAIDTLDAANAMIDEMLTRLRNNFNPELRKLGLELVMRKAPVPTIVVDRVEQTPTAN